VGLGLNKMSLEHICCVLRFIESSFQQYAILISDYAQQGLAQLNHLGPQRQGIQYYLSPVIISYTVSLRL
jgi:hypothetical protein